MNQTPNLVADDIVVGEGVALDIPSAGIALRIGACLIDMLMSGIMMFAFVYLVLSSDVQWDFAIARVLIILTIFLGLVGFPVTVETLTHGKSIGRFIFGTRVVRDDQGPSGFQQALVRHLIGVVEIWGTSGVMAIISVLLSRKGRRLGDIAAGTLVIKERIPLKVNPPMPMPPHLQQWASSADVASLPPGLALAIRQFIGRRATFYGPARTQLASDLARQTAQYVYPLPDASVNPEDFLMAVTAERARRDGQRLARNRRLSERILASSKSAS
ncbi:MAG: RDD family protein [Actinomycetaceae bacterium]|nr:RDD family protein [Actinomycetaceae bacterium]